MSSFNRRSYREFSMREATKVLPRLLMFCPAERIIMSDVGSISIINILEGLNVALRPGIETPPSGEQFPMAWAVFSYWERSDTGEEQTFEQLIEAFPPGASVAAFNSGVIHFTFGKGMQRMRVNQPFFGFPVGAPGDIKLITSVRSPSEKAWHESGRFVVRLEYQHAPSEPS